MPGELSVLNLDSRMPDCLHYKRIPFFIRELSMCGGNWIGQFSEGSNYMSLTETQATSLAG